MQFDQCNFGNATWTSSRLEPGKMELCQKLSHLVLATKNALRSSSASNPFNPTVSVSSSRRVAFSEANQGKASRNGGLAAAARLL